jgi:hypothetical protein
MPGIDRGRRRVVAAAGALPLAALGGGCAWLPRPATVPMKTIQIGAGCDGPAAALGVFLPGADSLPEAFVDEGFVAALRASGAVADVIIADAHLAYFGDRSVLDRLRTDVLGPARAVAPSRKIWLVGISLGAFAALGVLARQSATVDGALLIAPYPGRRPLLQQIEDAGGPAAWRAHGEPDGPDDLEFDIWQRLAAGAIGVDPPVDAGYGRDDRFAAGQRLLASTLPASQVRTVPGGHDWPAWRALWVDWLGRGRLPRGCPAR